MEIERRETLTAAQANAIGWPLRDGDVALVYRLRCERGCIGTFRMPVDRGLSDDAEFMAGVTASVLDFADTHVCLRKAVVGDRYWCALCGCFADTVDRRGELRPHQRMVRTGDTWDGGVDVERCPGGSVGRKVA